MSHNARVTEHKRRASARRRPRAAKRNPFDGLRKTVCEQIGIRYESITAPRNHRELIASEWDGYLVPVREANTFRTYRPQSWEIIGESAGA